MSSRQEEPGVRSFTTLSRDLADFLVEFSIVLHKRAMYPLGHPHLQESTERFVDRLESLLAPRDSLAIGVARHQLIVAGVATDPRNALRLHAIHGAVDDVLGDRLLALLHDRVHELGQNHIAELGVRVDLAFLSFVPARHSRPA